MGKEVNRKAIADGDQTGRIATVLECTAAPGKFGIVALNANGSAIAANAITGLTGDGTATGPGVVPFTLATVNGNVGTFGTTTQTSTFTVNAKGLITAASNTTIAAITLATPGTSGTDINWSTATVSVGGTATLNVPSASATNRGVVTTGIQTFAGAKTFSSTPTFSTMTQGSVLFAGPSGILSQDNANFFFDDTNNRLGLLTNAPNSNLDNRGSEAINTVTITTNYTVLDTDHVIRCNATVPITITLQSVVSRTGRKLLIEDVSGNASVNHITIAPSGAETIMRELNHSMMGDFRTLEIISDGVSNWNIIGGFADNFFQANIRFCSIFATNSSRDETGFSTLTTSGTLLTSFIATLGGFRAFNTITTANGAGSFGGVSNGNTFALTFIRQQEPNFTWIIRTGAVLTTQRIWVGFGNTIAGNSDTLPSSGMYFRYSSVVPDANWQFVTRDGVTQNVVDSGVAVTASTTYTLKLRFDNTNGRALFSINAGAETIVTANLPAASLGMGMSCRINNTVGGTPVSRLISFIKGRYT